MHAIPRFVVFLLFVAAMAPSNHSQSPETMRITTLLPGLLGNLMFDYAVLLGVAKRLDMQPHLSLAASVFPLSNDNSSINRAKGFAEVFGIVLDENIADVKWDPVNASLGWGRFDVDVLQPSNSRNVRLSPSFSFKYFETLEKGLLRQAFRFPQYADEQARSYLEEVRNQVVDGRQRKIVGMHIRRGDKLWEFDMFNEWSHGAGYVSRAMQVLGQLFGHKIIFVVATDDPQWAQALLGHLSHVFISPHQTPQRCKMEIGCTAPVLDMCLLARTDAVVVSGSSTYSWWAAFLAPDHAVAVAPRLPVNPQGVFGPCEEAQLELPGPGLPHARCRQYWSQDYFPPDWILLDQDPTRDVFPAWWGPHVALLPPHGPGVEAGKVVRGAGFALRVRISHQGAGEVTCLYLHGALVAAFEGEGSGLTEAEATLGSEVAGAVEAGACVVGREEAGGGCGWHPEETLGCLPFAATLQIEVSAAG